MEIQFGDLIFNISSNGEVCLVKFWTVDNRDAEQEYPYLKAPVLDFAGGESSGRYRHVTTNETKALKYVSHTLEENRLVIVQKNDKVQVVSTYESYGDTNAIRITQELTNISDEEQCLELANTFGLNFGRDVVKEHKDWYLHRFTNARYTEAMPDVRSLYDLGLYWDNGIYKMINAGNVSSLDYIPQGILENRKTSDFFMFQIESYSSWYVEVATVSNMFALQLGGPNAYHHAWNRILQPGQSYRTVPVALCYGKSVNSVAAEITRYRRHLKPQCEAEKNLPTVFNEYMHYSWDNPFEDRTLKTAPYVAKAGVNYYVIDCGWQSTAKADNELSMYKLFGTWKEDRGRFPNGLKSVSDAVHDLGMKFGLWVSPEVVGCENQEMLDYYGDECFLARNGKKIFNGTGYLLDYRQKKVRDYMTATIDRMVQEYGCDYIKFDGSPNPGLGTDARSTSLGAGLEDHILAYTAWSEEMTRRHPNVIFEGCAMGGQRMDYKSLSIFHLLSTSDQINYMHYPYIMGNVLMAVLPEQAAVWSYPVDTRTYNLGLDDGVDALTPPEKVVLNMVNALLGRVHLASRIHLLDEQKQALIREGIDFYNRTNADKLTATPYLPKGYNCFGDTLVAAGLKTESKVYLAVWNLHGDKDVTLPLPEITAKNITVAYPNSLPTKYTFTSDSLTIHFTEEEQARIFEITL
ncbi:MAG: alpha-galactosidase [Ruminococcaceae bacterium]|nr:alpha-galactosidase [Oscillospiraceae bacterium]